MKIVSSGFIIQNNRGEILLGKVNSHHPPYQYTIFKGGQEDGETLLETAIRELKEETGIDLSSEHRLNRYISYEPVFSYHLKHKDVHLFFLEDVEDVLKDFNFECKSYWGDTDNPEIDEYKWVKIEDLNDYLFPSQRGLADFLKYRQKDKK